MENITELSDPEMDPYDLEENNELNLVDGIEGYTEGDLHQDGNNNNGIDCEPGNGYTDSSDAAMKGDRQTDGAVNAVHALAEFNTHESETVKDTDEFPPPVSTTEEHFEQLLPQFDEQQNEVDMNNLDNGIHDLKYEDAENDLQDGFPDTMNPFTRGERKKYNTPLSKKRKRKKIPIIIKSFTLGSSSRTNRRQQQGAANSSNIYSPFSLTEMRKKRKHDDEGISPFKGDLAFEHLEDLDMKKMGMGEFYSETHEDQDPANIELTLKKEGKRREEELIELSNKKKATHATILQQLGAMWKVQLQNFEHRCEELHEKMNTRQLKQRDELAEQYNATIKALEEKGSEEMRNLNEKNKTYLNEINNKYRQWMNPRGELPPQMMQMKAVDFQQNRSKVMELQHNLSNKVKELLAETEADHQKKRRKLQRHHQHRKDDLKSGLKYMRSKLQQRHYQFKILRIREHEEKFQIIQKEIRERNFAFHPVTTQTKVGESKETGRKDSPVVNKKGQNKDRSTAGDCKLDEDRNCSTNYQVGAAMRQKRRKAFLTRSFIPSLMIEIHNEGLNVSCRTGEKNDESASSEATLESKEKSKVSCDFIPWGYAARRFLHSIICGEIPNHDITDNKLTCNLGLQGQIKCLVLDLRVSAEEALGQREVARKSVNLQELSKHAADLKASLSNDIQAETMCGEKLKRSERDWEKAKLKLQNLRTQTASMKETDLAQILKQYNDMVVKTEIQLERNKEKLKSTRQKRIITTDAYKKILRDCDHAKRFQAREDASKEYNTDELASYLFTLHKVTNERKKSSLTQKDKVQTKPNMVVLREPKKLAREARIAMRDFAVERDSISNECEDSGSKTKDDSTSIEDAIRAEQLLLLSLHPAAEKKLSAVPPPDPNGNVEWAEPGWHLNLDVPPARRHKLSHNSALHIAPHSSHFNCLYSEFSSSQGHQTASLLDTHHLKILSYEGNLYKNYNSSTTSSNLVGTDPLCRDEEEIARSYNFELPPHASKPSSRRRSKKGNTSGKGKKRKGKEDSGI